MNEHIIIITGASSLDADLVTRLREQSPENTVWIAVDGGLDHVTHGVPGVQKGFRCFREELRPARAARNSWASAERSSGG